MTVIDDDKRGFLRGLEVLLRNAESLEGKNVSDQDGLHAVLDSFWISGNNRKR